MDTLLFSIINQYEIQGFHVAGFCQFRLRLYEISVVWFHLDRIHSGTVHLKCVGFSLVQYHPGVVQFESRSLLQVNSFGT